MTPEVRVVRGHPDDVELAALVAGLVAGSAVGSGQQGEVGRGEPARREERARHRWRECASPLADPLRPAPDAWRWSTRV